MVYRTKIGDFELNENEIINFPEGIPGFENLRKFAVISLEETAPLCWLVSLEDDTIALPIIDPWLILDDYEVELSESELKILGVEDPGDLIVWSVVTIPVGKPDEATVNLKAPIIINLKKGIGAQIIMDKYEIRYSISGK
ncbi:MAG: flagellar assembly protein FliW [Fervidobacterium sp.]